MEADTGTLLRIRALSGRQGYSAAERAEIEDLSVRLLGRPVRDCPCPDRWGDAVTEMAIRFRSQIDMATANRYNLANGVVLEYEGRYYTHVNITDEVAQAYLEKYPNRARLFTSVPARTKGTRARTKAEAPKAEQ
ncbi:MAG: hypothetical protein LUC33_00915 [Prevotellaceae bacterium]|nr:hypothetical protein [Prevotellaceae bacterium]